MGCMAEEARPKQTRIRLLGSRSVMCHHNGCEQPASFLFRIDAGPIKAYCNVHANQQAARLGLSLPEPPMKVLTTKW